MRFHRPIVILSSLVFLWLAGGAVAQPAGSKADPNVICIGPPEVDTKFDLQAAIDAAPRQSVIRLAAGTYEGPLRITKPVTLEGAGWQQTKLTYRWHDLGQLADGKVPIPADEQGRFDELMWRIKKYDGDQYGEALSALWNEFGGKPTLAVDHARNVVFRGLTISMSGEVRAGGSMGASMVSVNDAEVRFEHCAVVGSPVGGIYVMGDADLRLHRTLIAGIRSSGIDVSPRTASDTSEDLDTSASGPRVRVERCDIRHCGYSGMVVHGPSEVEVDLCRISKTAFHGIYYTDVSPTVSRSAFFDIARGGMYMAGATEGILRDNIFLECSIWSHDQDDMHHDLIEYNSFVFRRSDDNKHSKGEHSSRQANAAIWIKGKSDPTLRRNLISGSHHGVILADTRVNLTTVERNIFDTFDTPIVRWQREGNVSQYIPIELPDKNQALAIRFADLTAGNYSLAKDQALADHDVGTREHAKLESPWPTLPEERELWRKLSEARAKQ